MEPTVLIVDEDVNAQIIAETLLRLRGLPVRIAGDGTEAWEIIRDSCPAVVVLDLSLPGMNGFEILRRLRGRFETLSLACQPRVVVVTDRREAEVERFVMRLGADAFLRKPVEPGQFIRTVERLMPTPEDSALARTPA